MVARVGAAAAAMEVPMTINKGEKNDTVAIKLATLNIQSGRAGNLEGALRATEKISIDIVVLKETKIVDDKYTKKAFGYEGVAMRAVNMVQGGLVLAYLQSAYWQI
jgi:hypothetical protein